MRTLLIFALACWLSACTRERDAAADDDGVFARLNDAPITRAEVRRMRDNPLTLGQLRAEHPRGVADPVALEELALRRVIERRLLIEEAERRGLGVEEKEVDEAVRSLRIRFPDLSSFGAWIKEQGIDEMTLFASVRSDLLMDKGRAALAEEVVVTDDEANRYLAAHRGELLAPGKVRLRVIASDDPVEIEHVIESLRQGAPFEELARVASRGIRAADGGDTGFVEPTLLPEVLRRVVATLRPGQTYGPVRRGDDLLIVRLEERGAPRPQSLAEARPTIERRVREAAVRDWLERARERSRLVRCDD